MKKQPIEQYKPTERLELKEIKKELPKVFKKVSCPSCEKEVTADNLNLQNSLAKCDNCNVIFSIEKEVEIVKSKKEIKQEVFRPEGVDLFFYKDEMDITIQQHIQGLDAAAMILIPIIALFSIIFFFDGKINIPAFIPITFSLWALYYIYKGFNYSKYKTYIDINDKQMSIKSRPKNFKKDQVYAADEIDQLYLKHSTEIPGYYTIHMIVNSLEGQKHVQLVTVNTLSKAKYLEQEIEWYLKIEDRKIPEANV